MHIPFGKSQGISSDGGFVDDIFHDSRIPEIVAQYSPTCIRIKASLTRVIEIGQSSTTDSRRTRVVPEGRNNYTKFNFIVYGHDFSRLLDLLLSSITTLKMYCFMHKDIVYFGCLFGFFIPLEIINDIETSPLPMKFNFVIYSALLTIEHWRFFNR